MPENDKDKPDHVTVHAIISGRVQGVSFRANLRHRAVELNVAGWTRNLPEGNVEALLQGSKKDVDALLEWCRLGPKLARVDSVREERFETPTIYRGFSILV
jgi:acylphosphatase